MLCGAAVWIVECMALVPAVVVAQRGPESRIILTLRAGVVASDATLWTIARQPLLVTGTETDPQPRFDTVSLTRGFVTNLIVGVAGAYFPSSTLGIEVDVTRLGLTYETSCSGIAFDSLLGATNRYMCEAIHGSSRSLGAIAFTVGGLARAFPRKSVAPYGRVGIGVTYFSVSTTYLEGPTPTGIKVLVDDPSPEHSTVSLLVGAGALIALGPGYNVRFDIADLAERFQGLTGPADRLARASRGHRFTHHVTFSLGFGIVLDAKRGRRY
jgi:hypothetical protein